MSKHTPGPWIIEHDKIGPRSREDDQSYGMIMPVAFLEIYSDPNFVENALLICAAPALLEALEELRKSMISEHLRIPEYVDAAIAKAKGEQ